VFTVELPTAIVPSETVIDDVELDTTIVELFAVVFTVELPTKIEPEVAVTSDVELEIETVVLFATEFTVEFPIKTLFATVALLDAKVKAE
jgi:hypothetical protein